VKRQDRSERICLRRTSSAIADPGHGETGGADVEKPHCSRVLWFVLCVSVAAVLTHSGCSRGGKTPAPEAGTGPSTPTPPSTEAPASEGALKGPFKVVSTKWVEKVSVGQMGATPTEMAPEEGKRFLVITLQIPLQADSWSFPDYALAGESGGTCRLIGVNLSPTFFTDFQPPARLAPITAASSGDSASVALAFAIDEKAKGPLELSLGETREPVVLPE